MSRETSLFTPVRCFVAPMLSVRNGAVVSRLSIDGADSWRDVDLPGRGSDRVSA